MDEVTVERPIIKRMGSAVRLQSYAAQPDPFVKSFCIHFTRLTAAQVSKLAT